MASRIIIRPGRSRDIPQLGKIEKAARTRYASAGRLSFATETPPIAANRLAEGDIIVAEADGHPVGFVLMSPMDGTLYFANISVDPAVSGQGFGAALIEAADEHATAKGLTALTLMTFRVPRWNAPWFRRIGFQPMPPDRIGPSLRAVLERHRQFLDMRTRVTMWRPIASNCVPVAKR
jgi:predicted N-acetyltransferase YhbS